MAAYMMIKRHGKHDFEPCDCWDNWTSLQNPNTNRRIIQVVRAQEGQNLGREVWSKKEEEAEGRCFDAHRRERGCWKGFEVTLLFLGPIIGRTGGFSSPQIWSKLYIGVCQCSKFPKKKKQFDYKFLYCKLFPVLQLAILLVKLPPPRLQLLQHLILGLHWGQTGNRFWKLE